MWRGGNYFNSEGKFEIKPDSDSISFSHIDLKILLLKSQIDVH